ncbi:MAG: HEPN domain-containing protein [Patescibacteria group bacterium]|nr:HEPN domain-containing protein [Patescibacteria group bacterium]
MKEILKKWILFAEADLDAAKRLFKSPKPTQWTYLLILWHCHQTIEKGLKMAIIKRKKELIKIHDLQRLVETTEINFSPGDFVFIKNLNKYYFPPRYPDIIYGPLPKPDKNFINDYLEKTDKLFIWLQKQ